MTGKYRTIVADPPWPYPEGFTVGGTNHLINGRKRTAAERGPSKRIGLPYSSLSIGELGALPIPSLAAADSRLFLWATNRYLPDALTLLCGWGFGYRQTLVWDKTPNFNPLPAHVAPVACEFLLVAVCGKPERLGTWHTSVIQARKPRSEHSVKPDVFLGAVEHVSPGPYLELFARRQRLGWDTWGNEALEHVSLVDARQAS